MAPNPRHQRIGSLLVLAQFGLIGLCLLPIGPTIWTGLRGWGLLALALAAGVGAWALASLGEDTRVHPVPGEATRLRTHGIYAWVRHPMYLAVLLACLGVTLSTGRLLSLVAWLCLVVVLVGKARFEDGLLRARYGTEHDEYASGVPGLLPAPWRSHRRTRG